MIQRLLEKPMSCQEWDIAFCLLPVKRRVAQVLFDENRVCF